MTSTRNAERSQGPKTGPGVGPCRHTSRKAHGTGRSPGASTRVATEEDIPALLELVRAYATESPYYDIDEVVDEIATGSLAALVDMGRVEAGIVDGNVVGMCGGYVVNDMLRDRQILAEVLLYVLPSHRVYGLATMLVRKLEVWGHSRGAVESRFESGSGIEEGRVSTLYHRLGYDNAGRTYSRILGGPPECEDLLPEED